MRIKIMVPCLFHRITNGVSPYGVYNMAGNVIEWVEDWYNYYQGSKSSLGPALTEKFRVLRGGAWDLGEKYLRTTKRYYLEPNEFSDNIGFRCAKDVAP